MIRFLLPVLTTAIIAWSDAGAAGQAYTTSSVGIYQFPYPPGADLVGQADAGGQIWSGVGPAGPSISIISGNLSSPDLLPALGNRARIQGFEAPSVRIGYYNETVLVRRAYFSLLMKVPDLGNLGPAGGTLAALNDAVGSSPDQPSPLAARLLMRSRPGGYQLGLGKNSGNSANWVWAPPVFDTNDTVFVVANYEFKDAQPDTASLWINPNADDLGQDQEPPPALTADSDPDIEQLASFVLLQRPQPVLPAVTWVDEIRVGTTWASVTPVPLDFADAPDAYHTLFASNGPRHRVRPNWHLGPSADYDLDGVPRSDAEGDDTTGSDDEDGVSFPTPLIASLTATVRVEVTVAPDTNGYLNAWMDFNRNGQFDPGVEHVLDDVPVASGIHDFDFVVPPGADAGTTYARFRLSNLPGVNSDGFGGAGEVEDYRIDLLPAVDLHLQLDAVPSEVDLGDPVAFSLTVSNGGPSTATSVELLLSIPEGATVESLASSAGSCKVQGSNIVCTVSNLAAQAGISVEVQLGTKAVFGSQIGEEFFEWLDFPYVVSAPETELNSEDNTTTIRIVFKPPLDFGDAPAGYPVTRAENGARHRDGSVYYLGTLFDREKNGTHSAAADYDDLNGAAPDDEDGVALPSHLVAGGRAIINVTASVGGLLDAWIDFDGNGIWDDPAERITAVRGTMLVPGPNPLPVSIPAGALTGTTWARFRFSDSGGLAPTGPANVGEVEDYEVTVQAATGPDLVVTADPSPLVVTENIPATLTLNVGNVGSVAATEVQLAIDLPDGLAVLSVSNSAGACQITGSNVSCSAASLPSHDTFTVELTVRARFLPEEASESEPLADVSVLATAAETDANPPNNSLALSVTVWLQRDFGDARGGFPVSLAEDGARHRLWPGVRLGTLWDRQADGFHSMLADWDDTHVAADEDGVVFLTPLIPGLSATVSVDSTFAGFLDAWADFNNDGDWADAGEQLWPSSQALVPGANTFTFAVPTAALPGFITTRWRGSTTGGLSYTGYGGKGEVEDYLVKVDAPVASVTVNLSALAGRATLSWHSVPGMVYTVEITSDFEEWRAVDVVTADAETTTWTDPDAMEGRRFYRIVVATRLTGIEPSLVPAESGEIQEVYLVGQNFGITDQVRVDGAAVLSQELVSSGLIRAALPALAEGFHTVSLVDEHGDVIAELARAIEATSGSVVRTELPPHGSSPGAGCPSCGAEVAGLNYLRPANGEVHFTVEDLRIQGRGLDFAWERTYRSRPPSDSRQGRGWDFSYNLYLVEQSPDVILHDGRGRADRYRPQTDGTWTADGFFRVLERNTDGTMTLHLADGGAWHFHAFDGAPAQGSVSWVEDRNGNQLAFHYDQAGRLTSVTDTLSREMAVRYNADGFIEALTDFTGREVLFAYYRAGDSDGGEGDLRSVTSPTVTGTAHGNDFPDGRTTVYTYTTGFADARLNHNLLRVTDPKGQTWLRNVYSASLDPSDLDYDRVSQQAWGEPSDTIQLTYVAENPNSGNSLARLRTIVNDRMGNVSELGYDSRNRLVRLRVFTGRADPSSPTTDALNRPAGKLRAEDPDWFTTEIRWNTASLAVEVVRPNGGRVLNHYESDLNPDASPRTRGNLRVRRIQPGPSGGDQPELVERFEYAPDFGNCCGQMGFVVKQTDGRGHVTRHVYDPRGNLLRTERPVEGMVDQFAYNEYGQLTEHVWPENGSGHQRHDRWVYHEDGARRGYLWQEIVDATGTPMITEHEPDARGNDLRLVDPRGHDLIAVFNQLDELVQEYRPEVEEGAGVRYRRDFYYDAGGNLFQIAAEHRDGSGEPDPSGHDTITYDFDVLNRTVRLTRQTDSENASVEEYEYDANGNRVLTRHGEAVNGRQPANTVAVLFDERDLPYQEIHGFGSGEEHLVQWDYDDLGVRRRRSEGRGDNLRVTLMENDGYGRPVRVTDAMGNVITRRYDENGNVALERVEGELLDVQGSAENVRLTEAIRSYDALDRLVRADLAFFEPSTQSMIGDGYATTLTFYTPMGEVSKVRDDRCQETVYEYDTANRRRRAIDPRGNVVAYTYDLNSNITTVERVDRSDSGATDQRFVTHYVYDNLNRRVQTIDSAGNTTWVKYDSRDQPVESIDARGNITRFAYDRARRLVRTTRLLTDDGTGKGASSGAVTTTLSWDDSSRLIARFDDNRHATRYAYDALDRLIVTRAADGTLEQVGEGAVWLEGEAWPDLSAFVPGHDEHGNVQQTTDANGTVVISTYDAIGRLASRQILPGSGVSDDATLEAYVYDGLSRLVRAADDDSNAQFAYDSLSHLIAEALDGLTTVSTHDASGNVLLRSYPGGFTVSQTFDALNRPQQVSDASGPIAEYRYVGPGRVERLDYRNGTRTDFTYDGLQGVPNPPGDRGMGRVIRATVTFPATGTTLEDWSFARDLNGNRTERAESQSATLHRYGYDSLNRLVTTGELDGNAVYSLDGANNRVSVAGGLDPGEYQLVPALPEPADTQVNQYTVTPFDSRTYDANGNLIAMDSGETGARALSFDYRTRLVAWQDAAAGVSVLFRYDCLGRRIEKAVITAEGSVMTTRYLFSQWQEIEERDADGTVEAVYVPGPGLDDVILMQRAGQEYYFHRDDLRNTTLLTDAAGAVVERYDYGDFGEPIFYSAAGAPMTVSLAGNTRLFNGRPYDAETELYNYRTRYLDPRAGRFLTRDTLGIWGDPHNLGNGYAYAANNPWTYADPMGERTYDYAYSSGLGRYIMVGTDGCGSTYSDSLATAAALAGTAASAAYRDVWNLQYGQGDIMDRLDTLERLKLWFSGTGKTGSLSITDRGTILDALQDTLSGFYPVIEVDCKLICYDLANAWVLNHNYPIHVCLWGTAGFWRDDLNDWDRAGVIYHEMTHIWAKTDDYGYYSGTSSGVPLYTYNGTTVALPKSQLKDNADTYEMFAGYGVWVPTATSRVSKD